MSDWAGSEGAHWASNADRYTKVLADFGALLVENGDRFESLNLRYAGGLREPRLERLPTGPDRLGASIAPRAR